MARSNIVKSRPSVQEVLQALEAKGCNPQPSGAGFKACCPAHDDHNPSLSVFPGDKGGVGIKCHSQGCTYKDILEALGLSSPPSNGRRRAGSGQDAKRPQPLPSGAGGTQFFYHNAAGAVAFVVVRRDTADDKTFSQWTPAGDDDLYLPKGPKGKRSLYGLPGLLAQPEELGVTVVEGEKCVDAFVQAWPKSAGLVTTWAGGTGSWRKTDWSPLSGRAVNLIADADTPGREAMRGLAAHLHGLDCTVRIALPEGETGDDIADGIEQDAGAALQFLKDCLEDYDPQTHKPPTTPKQAQADADLEQGRLPGESAFQLGRDLGRELAGQFRFVENPQGGDWFQSGLTHWNRCVIDKVHGEAQDKLLLAHLDAALKEMDGKRAAWLINGAWRHPSLNDALRGELAGELPTAPLSSIPTPAGIVTPSSLGVGEPRPFDPTVDGFLACTGAIPKDDLTFERLVFEWCGEDSDLANWLQRLMGAAMIGRAHRLVLNIIGPSGCGKSTFMRCLAVALAKLSMVANDLLFDATRGHNEQLADLIEHKPRLTFLGETQGKRLDADLLNSISGGEEMKARRPHGHDVEGRVVTLPVILGEAPFRIQGTTAGTMQRVHVVPFVQPSKADPELVERAADAAGIECRSALWWLLDGATRFLSEGGLGAAPAKVVERTKGAHADYDPIADWLMEQTQGGSATELLDRIRAAGIDSDNRQTTSSISRKAGALGWESTRIQNKRWLKPPPGESLQLTLQQ